MLFLVTNRSVAAVAKANCLRIGLALGNDFFYATVKRLALLLDSTETKCDRRQRNSRKDSGRNLNDAIGKHCFLLATAVLVIAAGVVACVLFRHKKKITPKTL